MKQFPLDAVELLLLTITVAFIYGVGLYWQYLGSDEAKMKEEKKKKKLAKWRAKKEAEDKDIFLNL